MLSKIRRLFNKGCTDYSLLADGDRILVGVSGGKDSLVLLEMMAMRARILKPAISVEAAYVVMDNIPYDADAEYLLCLCERLGVRLHVLHTSFDESTDRRRTKCFLCAWNRRKTLFRFAEDNGFNKVALGHHMDDFLVTYLMNITFEGAASTMQPLMVMEHYRLAVIRPLCLVHETMIRTYAEECSLVHQKAACPYESDTRRKSIAGILAQIESINPEARYSMWHAITRR